MHAEISAGRLDMGGGDSFLPPYRGGSLVLAGQPSGRARSPRKAPGFTAGQWERVRERAFRFAHRFGTEAEAVRRLPDLGTEAVAGGLPPARAGQDQPPSPGGDGAS